MNETQQAIQELRDAGWTFKQIAERLDVHIVTVQRWAAGTRTPDFDHMLAKNLRELLPKDVALRG